MLLRVSSLLLSLFLSSVSLDEGSCSKDGDKEDCGAKTENKFKYSTVHSITVHCYYFNCWLFRKTVLVTGGSGFVAHHVIEAILDNTDWNVVSLDRYRG